MWEAFYSPHTDDESIGMAGAIARATHAGHQTLVVLVTDNLPSMRMLQKFDGVAGLAAQRRVEWKLALRQLNVTRFEEWEVSELSMLKDAVIAKMDICQRMRDVQSRLGPMHHHTVMGADDIHVASGHGSLSHVICAHAAHDFAVQFPQVRVTLHGVYTYSRHPSERNVTAIDALSPAEFARKRAALRCYTKGKNTIGYGYMSVPELIDAASTDPREYVQEITVE